MAETNGVRSRFAPPPPSPPSVQPVSDSGTHSGLDQVIAAVSALQTVLEEAAANPPQVHVEPAQVHVPSDPRLGQLVAALGELHGVLVEQASRPAQAQVTVPQALLDRLDALVASVQTAGAGTREPVALDQDSIDALVKAMPKPPAFSGGSQTRRVNLLDSGNGTISPATEPTLSNVKTNTDSLDVALSTRASQTTLAALEGKDFATQATLAAILTELTRDREVAHDSASVTPAGGFQTVVSLTPAAEVVVEGFNADVASLVDISYRYQLTVDGAVRCQESITTNRNSWIPLQLTVAANSTIAVQVDHSEVGDQTFRATINYRE